MAFDFISCCELARASRTSLLNQSTMLLWMLHTVGVRWSGNLWGATGCETTVGCETATCLMNEGYPDGYCPPSTGPTGPVTKAEFTLASSCRTMHFDVATKNVYRAHSTQIVFVQINRSIYPGHQVKNRNLSSISMLQNISPSKSEWKRCATRCYAIWCPT